MFPDSCHCYSRLFVYILSLDSNLQPIPFRVEDDTFIVPVAGGSGLTYYLDFVTGHLLGEAIHLFFGTRRKRKMDKTEMLGYIVVDIRPNVGTVHDFETDTTFEGDEAAGKLLCRIMINRVDRSAEILPVELAYLVDVFCPDGDMIDFHNYWAPSGDD